MSRAKHSLRNWFRNVTIREKLYFVMGTMAFLIAAELFILYFTMHTLSATRAFVGGEGLYSKAQKEAAYRLRKYATACDENDYRAYQKFIGITMGDRKARMELEKKNPDEEIIYAGFLQGRNNREDIAGMIHLFKRFRHVSYIDKAISIWKQGDSLIDKLTDVSIKLHVLVSLAAPTRTKPEMETLVTQIDVLNRELTRAEDDFSFTLGEGSRWLEKLIMTILIVVALTVELTGLLLTVSINRGIARGLDEIMRASVHVAHGDFAEKAVINTRDELGKLAGSFNQMVEHLEQMTEDQRQTEEILRRQKDLYETLVVAQSELGEGVVITQDDTIVFANQALCRMYGYTEEELLSIPSYFDLVPPDERKRLTTIEKNRLNGLSSAPTGETTVMRKDGRFIDISYSRKIMKLGKKTQIISIVRDITGQKISEKKMEELAAIVQASDDAISTLSLDGIILNWNRGAEKIYGYTAAEMVGKHVSLLSLPGTEDEYDALMERIRKGETIEHFESLRKRKDGSEMSISTTASPIAGKGGEPNSIAIIARDISQSKQVATALKQKSDELVRSNTDLEQFAYIISHDLREPLRTMNSYIQLLQLRYADKLDAEANEFIRFAVDGAVRMNDLIQDLLMYSRVGYSVLNFEEVNCREIIETALNNLRESIRTTHAEITFGEMPLLFGSRTLLVQLFQNLIGNAIKFSSPSNPKIEIKAQVTGQGWLFSVSDKGIGIEKKFLERVFIVFQRLHAPGEYEGTGIGLAVCKKIVERHGGRIWCDSEPGKGSVFSFTLNPSILTTSH